MLLLKHSWEVSPLIRKIKSSELKYRKFKISSCGWEQPTNSQSHNEAPLRPAWEKPWILKNVQTILLYYCTEITTTTSHYSCPFGLQQMSSDIQRTNLMRRKGARSWQAITNVYLWTWKPFTLCVLKSSFLTNSETEAFCSCRKMLTQTRSNFGRKFMLFRFIIFPLSLFPATSC